ncbi:MAG: hypothetical protein GX796_05285 [Clostridiaceae bacterium]|jgi:hypothetical protein|nr:hypothetical protein [Clostridiaceae bacterium]
MSIKSAITDSGIPVKVRPFSLEVFEMCQNEDMISEIVCNRMGKHYRTNEYVKLQKELETLCGEITNTTPTCEKVMRRIENIICKKEVDCFEAGYQAGIADLITALTFNDLQITHAEVIDTGEIDKRRSMEKAAKENSILELKTQILTSDTCSA